MKKLSQKLLSFVLVFAMMVPMFVLPSVAEDTAPELITSPAGYSNIEVRVTTDKDPLNYRIGDKVTFTMKVYADNKHVSVPMIKCWLEGDGSDELGVTTFRKDYTLTPDANGVFTITENVISIPGYMRLEGDIYGSDGATKWAETPNNDRARALGAGILVNYEEITTVEDEPADFDAVWAKRLSELEAVAPKILRIDKVTTWYSGSTKKTASSSSDVYAIYIDCLGNTGDVLKSDDIGNKAGATWAVAYLTVPKNKSAKSMSVTQGYQGYGINTATPTDTTTQIGVNMSTHPVVLLNNENAATSTEYKSKYTSYIKGGTNYGYDATDNSKIETCYFANMLLRNLQVLRFVKQAFGTQGGASLVDSNTEINGMTRAELDTAISYWKGLYNGKISVSGGSQGGFQAIGVGAFEKDVVSVGANIPWMADTYIGTDSQRLHGSNRPTPGKGILYCDTAFLVKRVTVPVTITARLVDKSCVPTGVIAIWNNLVESKKDVEGYTGAISWAQSGTHGYTPSYAENQTQTLRTYELVEPAGVPNNRGGYTKSGFTDIDGYTVDQDAQPPATGYVQIGTSTKNSATVSSGTSPEFYYQGGANVYYNAELKKLVFVTNSSGSIAANYNQHGITASQNSNANGNVWYLAYWASVNKTAIKDVEFRCGTGGSTTFSGIGYLTTQLTGVETVKLDSKIVNCSWGGSKEAGVLVGMRALTSLGHGSFASDGTFTAKTYKDGVVNLTGFTGFSTSIWKYVLYNASSVTEVVAPSLAGANMFEGCSNLTKVTVPAGETVTALGANNFSGCNKLESINFECNISTLSVGSAAFSGRAIVINVKTDADKAVVTSALSAASVTNVTVLSAGEEPPAVEEPTFDEGIAYGEDGYTNSKYSDIDSATSGYVQIGTNDKTKATVTDTFTPKLYYIKNGSTTNGGAYYNPKQEKLVLTIDWGSLTGGTTDIQVNSTKNQDTVGATWYLAYWVKQNSTSIKEVEFRVINGTKLAYIGQFLYLFTSAVSVKFDSRITASTYSTTEGSGIFTKMTSLKSMGHGSIASDGTFTPTTYEEGTVNLLGFSETAAGNFAYCFNGNTSVKAAKTHTLADSNMFRGCSALQTVTVPAGATLSSVGENVFNGCSDLKNIYVNGTVDPAITIASTAFSGATQSITVTVNTDAEKGCFETALGAVSITNVTVVSLESSEPDEPDVPDVPDVPDAPTVPEGTITPIAVANVITSDGFQVRMKDYNGLRSLFTFNQSTADSVEGYTLVSYGAIAASYERFTTTYGSDEDALFAAARSNPDGAVKYVPVYNADGTGLNRYADVSRKQFCLSLTNIDSDNSLSDIYVAGYAIWEDAEGNLGYTLTTYDMPDGEKAVNLYEITLGLTKTGLINSEITDDVCFWQVLKNGALKVADTSGADYGDNNDKLVDGEFTYLDVNWHAYTGKDSGWWDTASTTKWTGVEEDASGLVWSVLKYTDDEYVLVYRNANKDMNSGVSIPTYSTEKGFDAPCHINYGNEGFKNYNPTLSQADYMKIQTLVVDHGVTGTAKNGAGLAGFLPVTIGAVNYGLDTIVYPSEFKAYEYTFTKTGMLKNVIWCHTDENGNPVEHMSEFPELGNYSSLIDLRGFTTVGFRDMFANCWAAENIVFRADVTAVSRKSGEEGLGNQTFNGAALKRVWSADQDVPEAGIMDVSGLPIVKITTKMFNLASTTSINTIILPSSDVLTAVAGSKTDSYTFGNKRTINYICDETLEAQIVAHINLYKANLKTQVANISINGKPITSLVTFG